MKRGRTISLFLLDGSVTGAIKYTLPNWTGVVYKIPRTALGSCKNREHLQQSGVYFLFGKTEERNENVVYVGQAGIRKNGNGLLGRILEHARNPEKDYWTEAVAITTTNNSFGPTEISYLENQFTKLATDAKRYIVKNRSTPEATPIFGSWPHAERATTTCTLRHLPYGMPSSQPTNKVAAISTLWTWDSPTRRTYSANSS